MISPKIVIEIVGVLHILLGITLIIIAAQHDYEVSVTKDICGIDKNNTQWQFPSGVQTWSYGIGITMLLLGLSLSVYGFYLK